MDNDSSINDASSQNSDLSEDSSQRSGDDEVGDNFNNLNAPNLAEMNEDLGDILNNPHLQSPLYTNSRCTLIMIIVLIWTFVAKYSLTKQAHQDLLDIINLILPESSILPKTIYLFKKLLPLTPFIIKYFCPQCMELFPETNGEFECACSQSISYSTKQLVEKGCYFLHVPIFPGTVSIQIQ